MLHLSLVENPHNFEPFVESVARIDFIASLMATLSLRSTAIATSQEALLRICWNRSVLL